MPFGVEVCHEAKGKKTVVKSVIYSLKTEVFSLYYLINFHISGPSVLASIESYSL